MSAPHFVDGVRQTQVREGEEVATVTAENLAALQAAAVMVLGKLVGSRQPRPNVTIDYAPDRPQAAIKVRSGDLDSSLVSRSLNRARDDLRKMVKAGIGMVWLTTPGEREAITREESRLRGEVLRKMVPEPDDRALSMGRVWAQTWNGRWTDVDAVIIGSQDARDWQKRARQSFEDGDPAQNGFEYARRKDGRIVLVPSLKLLQAADRVVGLKAGEVAAKLDELANAMPPVAKALAARTEAPATRLGPRCLHCGHARNLPSRVVNVMDRTSYAMTPKSAALEALAEAAQFALDEGASLDEVRLAVFRAMGLAPDEEATS